MTQKRSFAFAAGIGLIVLAACSGGSGGSAASQFGQAFARAFNSSNTTAPVEPANITFQRETGPSLTSAPIDI